MSRASASVSPAAKQPSCAPARAAKARSMSTAQIMAGLLRGGAVEPRVLRTVAIGRQFAEQDGVGFGLGEQVHREFRDSQRGRFPQPVIAVDQEELVCEWDEEEWPAEVGGQGVCLIDPLVELANPLRRDLE